MTDEEISEFKLLKTATEGGVFAIELGLVLEPSIQTALERLQRRRWVTLIDISSAKVVADRRLLRVFLATAEAMEWFRSVN
jgi:hypothetical protein